MVVILHELYQNIALGAISISTAVAIGQDKQVLTDPFLLKKIKLCYAFHGLTADEPLLLMLSYGHSNITETAAALALDQLGRVDEGEQAQVRGIIDCMVIDNRSNQFVNGEWEPRLPKKGLPFTEGDGWHWQVFSFEGNVTGGIFSGFAKAHGAWL